MKRLAAVLFCSIFAAAAALAQPGGAPDNPDPPWLPASYDPTWQAVQPTLSIPFRYDGNKTSQQNGAALAAAILNLTAGQRLLIGAGTYSIAARFDVVLKGTPTAPIWITAADLKAKPVLTRPDNRQNLMNVGDGGLTEYVCFRGLEFTGGDDLLKLYDCRQVWIDQCYIHDGDGVGIAANSRNTSHLHITRNEITNPGKSWDTGEGMYLGANYGAVAMSYSVVALNHVHHTQTAKQGDGIEVKQGSHHNWIVGNTVHDTRYPCILVYGTAGNGENVVERNVLFNSLDNTLQVQGEAVVRNNLVMRAAGSGFQSHNHQAATRNLTVIHNTIINSGRGANLSSWNGATGVVFANNVVYSRTAESIRFPSGSAGVTLTGNVVLGPVTGASRGTVNGKGLQDFVDVSLDAAKRDARPAAGSPINGRGDRAHAVPDDLTGALRMPPLDPGALDARPSLTTDKPALSLQTGGTQTFALDAGFPFALRSYLLAGSLSGVRPGLGGGWWIVPLNPDPYFFHTVLHPNTAPLLGSVGSLDAAGRAAARFVLPRNLPATLAGLRFHHAFAVVAGAIAYVSNPAPLDLIR